MMYKIPVLLASLLLLNGCQNEKTPEPIVLPSSIVWKVTAFTISKNSALEVDFYTPRADCQNDDSYTFNSDGRYVREEGATKCNPTDPLIVEQGKWTRNRTVFTLQEDGSPTVVTFEILELTETTFIIQTIQVNQADTFTYTYTLQAI